MERSGLPLGRVLGVPVRLSPSWFLFAGFIVYSYGGLLTDRFGATTAYAAATAHALLLLVSVLLHEIGHCAVARAYGLPVRSITITFLAGLTEITVKPQTAAREFWVAVAGPLVSLVLAGLLLLTAVLLPGGLAAFLIGGAGVINAAVAVFNLLPGLPLDGGRVLRAAVWRWTGDAARSTVVAAQAGRVVAVASVPLTLLWFGGVPSTFALVVVLLVAVFLWQGASASLVAARVQERAPRLGLDALVRRAVAVPPDLPVSQLVQRVQEDAAGGAVVVDPAGRLLGVVLEEAVAAVPVERRPWVTASSVSRSVGEQDLLDPGLSGVGLVEELVARSREVEVLRGPHGQFGLLRMQDVEKVLLQGEEPLPR